MSGCTLGRKRDTESTVWVLVMVVEEEEGGGREGYCLDIHSMTQHLNPMLTGADVGATTLPKMNIVVVSYSSLRLL